MSLEDGSDMKRQYILALVLATIIIWLPLKVSSATIKDNHLNLDNNRLSQDENETLGQQSNKVKDLFDPDTQRQLAKSKNGKKVLSDQEHQLFQKGKVVTTSAKQKNTPLFQSRVTHALDIKEGAEQDSWNWLNFWLYTGVITVALATAVGFSWWVNKKEEKENNVIH